ncbi:MAG TPA: sugar transferase [Actinomycetota bacterium]
MGLPHTIRAPVEWRSFAPPRRLPLGLVVPAADALALLVAIGAMGHLGWVGLTFWVASFAALRAAGTHRARINPRLSDDIAGILARLAVATLVLVPFVADDHLGPFMRLAGPVIVLVIAARGLGYKLTREARAQGLVVEPTLIVGAGNLGVQVATTLQEHPDYGLHPVGFLDSFEDDGLPLSILGDVGDLEYVIREFDIKRVIVAFGAAREPQLVSVIRDCDHLPVEVHVIPRFFELGVSPAQGMCVDDLWGIPLIRLRRSALRSAAWRTKRGFDLVVASLMLLVAAPVFAACALAVRLSGPGPVFFRQKRIGQRGEVFELLKFRTMKENDDSETTWSVAEDDRRTQVGAFLRRGSLDELPQLINVIRGEMSLVGPRPERPHFVDQFRVAVPGYDDRHRVPAGLTGWAQVHGLRGDTSIPERARFDNHYIEHWSLWRDVVIMCRTVKSVIAGSGR